MSETDIFSDVIHTASDGIVLTDSFESLFINAGVTVAGEGQQHVGVRYTGSNGLFATIAGNVFGSNGGINAGSGHAEIIIEKTGSVNALLNGGGGGAAVALVTGSVTNNGSISGSTGVGVGGQATIHNTGAINAYIAPGQFTSAIFISYSGAGIEFIDNSGTMDGAFGVKVSGKVAMAVTNSGNIAGNYNAICFGTGAAADVLINSGTISSLHAGQAEDAAVLERGTDSLDVTNSGHIQSTGIAIYDLGTANLNVINTVGGVISGQTGILYNANSGGAADLLTNDGTIDGKDSAVTESGSAVMYAVNSGIISGTAIGMQFNGAVALTDTLDNTGTIRVNYTGGAAIRENGAAELTITNSGHIVGNVVFGIGGGSYDGTQGHITGGVVGAITGSDTFKGGGDDEHFFGSGVNDVLKGGGGDDVLRGGAGRDKLTGGHGSDTFVYLNTGDSHGAASHDTVFGFDAADDQFDFDVAVTGVDAAISTGSLSNATFNADLSALLNGAHLHAGHAVLVTADAGGLAGHTFLVVDHNHTAGYQSTDYVIELSGTANLAGLSVDNFI